jgi:hypothetical protein
LVRRLPLPAAPGVVRRLFTDGVFLAASKGCPDMLAESGYVPK